jgi:hypothetical protein
MPHLLKRFVKAPVRVTLLAPSSEAVLFPSAHPGLVKRHFFHDLGTFLDSFDPMDIEGILDFSTLSDRTSVASLRYIRQRLRDSRALVKFATAHRLQRFLHVHEHRGHARGDRAYAKMLHQFSADLQKVMPSTTFLLTPPLFHATSVLMRHLQDVQEHPPLVSFLGGGAAHKIPLLAAEVLADWIVTFLENPHKFRKSPLYLAPPDAKTNVQFLRSLREALPEDNRGRLSPFFVPWPLYHLLPHWLKKKLGILLPHFTVRSIPAFLKRVTVDPESFSI